MTRQTSIIESLYAAVARGDIDAIRQCLADNVQWECATESASLPWLPMSHGAAAVAEAFRNLPGVMVRALPQSFLETADVVAATVQFEATMAARAEGAGDWTHGWTEVHHWQFDASGRVCRLRQRIDLTARAAVSPAGRLIPFTPPGLNESSSGTH
jgi:ketosteroid isomerase-like protein